MNLTEILSSVNPQNSETIEDAITKIKAKRRTEQPDTDQIKKDLDPSLHDVMDKSVRKDEIKIVQPEIIDPMTQKVIQSEIKETVPVNRIAIPMERDITNIHTSFVVGTPPDVTCENPTSEEHEVFKLIKTIDRKCKLKYQNRKIVRAWLSEQEICEYWYAVPDTGNFWNIDKSIGQPQTKLRSVLWHPLNGDTLYPCFSSSGDYEGIGRAYQVPNDDGDNESYFQVVTESMVYLWKDGDNGWETVEGHPFSHGFEKNPTLYAYRSKPLCADIRPIRERIEVLHSNYADCIDYNFAPKLVAVGEVTGSQPKGARGGLVSVEHGGDLKYLSWQQTPETVRLELETLTTTAYAMTNTPRITFESLKGVGNALSGTAFKFAFMGAHMAVENHAETIGDMLQRRYNFLSSAIGTIIPKYKDASETIEISVEIVPYMIDNLGERIQNAVNATKGKVASERTGIILAGLVEEDKIKEEMEAIEGKGEQ